MENPKRTLSNNFFSNSRKSTPTKKPNIESLNTILQDLKTEKKISENLSSRVSSLDKLAAPKFITRSVTPLASKLLDHKSNLDLNQVSRTSIVHPKYPVPRTETQSPHPVQPGLYRISPNLDSSVSSTEKNIESLRLELQQRREMIVGLKDSVSRKQLEHKYWALVSEIEETGSRLMALKKYNKEMNQEIRELNSGFV